MSNDTSGPAFPVPEQSHYGISMRDYLAAKAMQGLLAAGDKWSWRDTDDEPAPMSVATTAYELADAMLASGKENA